MTHLLWAILSSRNDVWMTILELEITAKEAENPGINDTNGRILLDKLCILLKIKK